MEKVTPQEALQRMSTAQLEGAQTGMRMAKGRSTIIVPEFISTMGSDFSISTIPNENSTLYFFNNGNGGLILPAYDTVTPVLGESDKADFTLEIPPHVEGWFKCYAEEIDAIQKGDAVIVESPTPPGIVEDSTPRSNVNPLITATDWHQKSPFNSKLWYGGLEHYVGCSVVAAAQILHYWGTLGYYRGCPKSSAFTGSGANCTIPEYKAVQVFDYPNLVNNIQTETQKEAITYLLAKIGSAFKVIYGSSGTGLNASDFGARMRDCFKFNPNLSKGGDYGSSTYIYAEGNEESFNDEIYRNLSNGWPVAIAADSSAGGAHIFVCDGYRTSDGKFHIDFGWPSSYYDGWYTLDASNGNQGIKLVSGTHFNNHRWAWIDVIPNYKLGDTNNDNNVGIEDAITITNYIKNSGTGKTTEYDITSNGAVTGADLTYIINKMIKDADNRYVTQ